MKKTFALMIIICLMLTLLTACGKSASGGDTPNTANNSGVPSDEDVDKALSQLAELTGMNEWPTDKLPASLPEYTDGEVINHGDFGDGEYVVKIKETGEDALNAYKKSLEADGWQLASDRAMKAENTIEFMLSGTDLQLIAYTADASDWPAEDKLPAALLAPEGYTVMDIQLTPNGDDVWLLNYTVIGMDEAASEAYAEALIAKGWQGDISQMTIDTTWKGKPCGMILELYAYEGGNTLLTCNYGNY